MADDLRPIIVKRVKKVAGGHHGGAWKIAFADFMTAMMAFFLMMWLLGSVSKGDLKGISEYFSTPIKVALSGGSGVGDATSIVQGGGTDLSRSAGQVKKGDPESSGLRSKPKDLKAAKAELERLETEKLSQLKMKIESAVEAHKVLRMFKKQLLLDITSEGLRIQIVDEQNRPMFALASAELQTYTKEILYQIGSVLNDVPNKISISGHTDSKPFAGGEKGYSNWELSSDRANACRRALLAGGMEDTKVVRVVGLASSVLLDKEDPEDPINRRISIVVMNKKAEEAALKDDNGALDIVTTSDIREGLKRGDGP
ncbi:flagellar motor protein MotB [Oxalobacter vibrioformis]|uniref:Flagellar motor protein MotB n=1 Tax=Oxalobacter vibrioformis TaxID=933080 RepID=A0A9E9LXQ7_9BURK|nr:flagellar motor protein MotB [Oxalobacter vibrioformis]NLC23637.1 flagellar motor protein MotB [Oxalobacter sp.]WAW09505.1 flagellar motor protein MotB [Oxalobacter vibrioformis]